MSEITATADVLLFHDVGLHARPSVKLTKLAKTFGAGIELSVAGGPWIDAKSIVKVMAMKAPKDSILHFRASGEDASDAVSALVDLVKRDFQDVAEAGTSVAGGRDVPSAG